VPFWTASATTKQILESHGVRRVQIIPYGVHTVALPQLDPKPIHFPLRLIMVSRLAPNKRVDHGIRALAELTARGVEAELTIVGGGIMEDAWRQLSADLGLGRRTRFAGSLSEEEKDEQLRAAHILLHTSLREGWGLNVIEANAMGTPAVVYPVAGLTESTLHDQTGLIAEAETPNALAESILRCVADPARYEVYRQAAWARAKSFHWSHVLPIACDWLERQARPAASSRAWS